MSELKVCSFCGDEAEVEREEPLFETAEEWYRVICVDCGGNAGWYISRDDAMDAWNSRV